MVQYIKYTLAKLDCQPSRADRRHAPELLTNGVYSGNWYIKGTKQVSSLLNSKVEAYDAALCCAV